jgi:shikimate kinase
MNIILCGMPCSGKTYHGRLAAQILKKEFIDTDELVITAYSQRFNVKTTCREIVLEKGISFFQELESHVVHNLKNTSNCIIATGGGTLCSSNNAEILKTIGCIVYLRSSPEVLLKRMLRKKSLPSYLNTNDIEGSFQQLLRKRLPVYEMYCHTTIDTSSENVIEAIKNYACKENHHGK